MTTLKGLKGTTIQFLDADPVVYAGSWSSGGAMNTARSEFGGGGTQTSGMAAGGRNASLTNNNAEIYNGTSWTAIATTNVTQRGRLGAGADNEAFIAIGGQSSTVDVENWNGSSWTEVNNLNTTKHATYGNMGTATAAIAVGYGSPNTTNESWNGTSWTEVNDLNTGGGDLAFFGTSTSGIIAGGNRPAQVAICESWNGSSWTEVADLNQSRENGSGAGSSNSIGIVFGGYKDGTGDLANTESWNGSAWTEVNDLATARFASGGAGSETAALCSGGRGSDTYQSATEEWSFPGPTSTILQEGDMWFNSSSSALKGYGTAAGIPSTSWAAGAAQNTTRVRQAATGGNATISVAQLCGGYLPSSPPPNDYFTNTEQYNGSAWTEVNDLNTAKSSMSGFGTQTSAIVAGSPGGIPPQAQTEAWDGSSWAGTADLNNGRGEGTGAGLTGTAGIVAAGKIPTNNYQNHSETWDGTSWTETANTNGSKSDLGAAGSQTSAMIFGGTPGNKADTEVWDGTSWTEVNNLNEGRYGVQGGGVSSSQALAAGGNDGSLVASTEFWNGTSWTELNNLSTARSHTQQCPGNAVSMVFSGGYPDSSASPAEEWAAEAAVSTVTTS